MPKKTVENNDLITEQPAWAILSSGLLVSFFLGFALKSYFNPARLSERISEAAQKIHPSLQIQFESSYLSLSRWGIPKLEVVITQVQAVSSLACWGQPKIHIDEIRIPLSFRSLLSQKDPIQGVELATARVHFTQAPHSCAASAQQKQSSEQLTTSLVAISPVSGKTAPGMAQGSGLEFFSIKHIQIHFDHEPRYYTELKNIQLIVQQSAPLKIVMDAGTELFKNEVVGDYLSNSKLRIEFDEGDDQSVLVHFFGNFREGYYSVIAKGSLSDRSVRMESELQNIPLGAVLSMLQRYGQSRSEVNANNLWLSLKAQSFFSADEIHKAGLNISKLAIEGDLLDLVADKVVINRLEPLSYEPIKVDIQNLNIQKVFEFYGRPHPTKAMGDLGVFKGSAEIRSENEISLVGILSGLEFIFANKGLREVQTVDSTLLDAQFLAGAWKLRLTNPQLLSGQLIGEVEVKADRFLNSVSMDLKIDELLLSPQVQKIMTEDGKIGALEARLQWDIRDKETKNMSGNVQLLETELAGLKLAKASAQIGFANQAIFVKSRATNLDIKGGEPLAVMKTFVGDQPEVRIEQAQMDFYIESEKALSWKNAQGTLQDGTLIRTSGGWNSDGLLAGNVTSQTRTAKKKNWKILGTRNAPLFDLETSP